MLQRRSILLIPSALATTLILAGCGTGTDLAQRPPPGYVGDVAARVAAVDWAQARPVTVELAEFAFQPEHLAFEQGVPYRLTLENRGNVAHTFTSEGFFKAIAVRRVTTPQGPVDTPALVNLEIPAGQTDVVEFVPVQAGTYALACHEPLHSSFGMTGTIAVR
ncbi:cupredoxin domain-containing protein [Azospirillum isscasi]|uniref:Cupredoxin domain-containing protein n=1 Tax=Azospirillum isscasi TaxID=3053926 RepID=A0ABU0WEL6_9PROT|nr:cupredoxin domain-containing protein [Azospirillum isscasi]MDQ2102659.1 cupredoxin domain-containing protein [Azospirillum isscasi]